MTTNMYSRRPITPIYGNSRRCNLLHTNLALGSVTTLGHPLEVEERPPRETFRSWKKKGIDRGVLSFGTKIYPTIISSLWNRYLYVLMSINMSVSRS